jgi:hypothetical protein
MVFETGRLSILDLLSLPDLLSYAYTGAHRH